MNRKQLLCYGIIAVLISCIAIAAVQPSKGFQLFLSIPVDSHNTIGLSVNDRGWGIAVEGNGEYLNTISFYAYNSSNDALIETKAFLYNASGGVPTGTKIPIDISNSVNVNPTTGIDGHESFGYNFGSDVILVDGEEYFIGVVQNGSDTGTARWYCVDYSASPYIVYGGDVDGWGDAWSYHGDSLCYDLYTSAVYEEVPGGPTPTPTATPSASISVSIAGYQYGTSTPMPQQSGVYGDPEIFREELNTQYSWRGAAVLSTYPYTNGNWSLYRTNSYYTYWQDVVYTSMTLLDNDSIASNIMKNGGSEPFYSYTADGSAYAGKYRGWRITGTLTDQLGVTTSYTYSWITYLRDPTIGQNTPTPNPSDIPTQQTDTISRIAWYLVALVVVLVPAFLLGKVAGMGSWGYLIGLAIGAGLGYILMPTTVPLWIFFAIIVGIVGFLMKGSLPIGGGGGKTE